MPSPVSYIRQQVVSAASEVAGLAVVDTETVVDDPRTLVACVYSPSGRVVHEAMSDAERYVRAVEIMVEIHYQAANGAAVADKLEETLDAIETKLYQDNELRDITHDFFYEGHEMQIAKAETGSPAGTLIATFVAEYTRAG